MRRSSGRRPHCLADPLRRRGGILMFPDPDDTPAEGPKDVVVLPIATAVRLKLVHPEGCVRRGHMAMLGARMPEAAVDEHGDARCGEHDVRPRGRSASSNSAIDEETESIGMQGATDCYFRPRIPPSVPPQLSLSIGHALRAFVQLSDSLQLGYALFHCQQVVLNVWLVLGMEAHGHDEA